MTELDDIVTELLSFEGIKRKYVLPAIIGRLRRESYGGRTVHGLGEDSAIISTELDDYILLTTDSIVEELCVQHPRAAGFNVVLANVMDIYAAGGIPTTLAVALSFSETQTGDLMIQGLIDASHIFRVPIVRGHTNPCAKSTYVVGTATGRVKKTDLLTAGGAHVGDVLALIFDRHGRRGVHYKLGWDCVTGHDSEHVLTRLSAMNELAQCHIVNAAKDVSVAGIVGTAGMMLEYSGVGGTLYLTQLKSTCPPNIPLHDWLRMYLSLGFLLSLPHTNMDAVSQLAERHGLSVVQFGVVDDSNQLRLQYAGDERVIFDFSDGPVLIPK